MEYVSVMDVWCPRKQKGKATWSVCPCCLITILSCLRKNFQPWKSRGHPQKRTTVQYVQMERFCTKLRINSTETNMIIIEQISLSSSIEYCWYGNVKIHYDTTIQKPTRWHKVDTFKMIIQFQFGRIHLNFVKFDWILRINRILQMTLGGKFPLEMLSYFFSPMRMKTQIKDFNVWCFDVERVSVHFFFFGVKSRF